VERRRRLPTKGMRKAIQIEENTSKPRFCGRYSPFESTLLETFAEQNPICFVSLRILLPQYVMLTDFFAVSSANINDLSSQSAPIKHIGCAL
jgi:hypothetical protein